MTFGLGALAVGVTIGIVLVLQVPNVDAEKVKSWAPPVSACLASLAFLLSAYTYARTSRRARQAVTYEAWGRWNDGTRTARRQLRNKYPDLTEAVARDLARLTATPLADTASEKDRSTAEDAHKLGAFLTGLERIAVGCDRGLYDLDELDKLGAAIIIRTERLYAPYIRTLRTERNHPKAYNKLQALAMTLATRHKDV